MQSLAMAMPAFRKLAVILCNFIHRYCGLACLANPGPGKSLLEGCMQRSHECDGLVSPFVPKKSP